ncbi:MAG: hypothetical protein IPG97_16800 [Microthrixaceae bacterium]|nr:hypothetical protein [Microthrixaceae bacterium]
MALVSAEVDGLDELIAGLKASSQGLAREQRKANKKVAEEVSEWARSAARSGTRQQVLAAGAIKAPWHSVDGPSGDLWWPWLCQGCVLGHVSPDRLVCG